MPGEFDFINWIRSQQKASDLVQIPAGDDLAVLKWNADDLLLVGVDQVLDGVHFDSTIHSPRQIGKKVMNRNLSDCAAMACLPAAAVVTVALPKGTTIEYSKELYLGIKEAGDVFDCPIVGGDTATWDGKLLVTVTILGASAGINPITRSGALPGDSLYVTGPLGGSRQRRHMEFQPRVHQARMLAKTGLITAAIDISDGLSRDLAHICEQSGVGAILEGVPIHEDAIGLSDPLQHALHDGEDHELLFTSTASFDALWQRVGEATTEWPIGIIQIGSITAERGIFLADRRGKRTPLEPKGWEHTF